MWMALVLVMACENTPDVRMAAPSTAPVPPVTSPARLSALDVRALSFPAAWLAEQVGGAHVAVTNILPAGEDPPFWQPAPELVASLADADLIVANGAGFEAWTATATLPASRLVALADGLDLITLPGVTHSHGKDGSHSHAGTDPHTWSDPMMLAAEAARLRDALIARDPAAETDYRNRADALTARLSALDAQLASALAGAKGQRLSSSHPAFNYLARRYGLDLQAFTFDPDEPVDAEARAAFEAWAATAGDAPILLWEATPSSAVVASLPEQVRHVVIDPLEQPSAAGYDYLGQAEINVAVFERLFAPTPADQTQPASP